MLLRVLAGELEPTEGERKAGPSIRFGHLAQDRRPDDPNATPLELVRRAAPISEGEAVSRLMKFLFSYEQVRRPTTHALGRRVDAAAAPAADARRRELPAARRADQPPRHRVGRDARGCARVVRRHGDLRLPRPLLPRPDRRSHRRGRRRWHPVVRGRLVELAAANRASATTRRSARRADPPARSRADRASRRRRRRPSSRASRASSTATATAFAPSSREVGSSASSSDGRETSARAIATRARSPCDSRETRCVARSASPDRLERCAARPPRSVEPAQRERQLDVLECGEMRDEPDLLTDVGDLLAGAPLRARPGRARRCRRRRPPPRRRRAGRARRAGAAASSCRIPTGR